MRFEGVIFVILLGADMLTSPSGSREARPVDPLHLPWSRQRPNMRGGRSHLLGDADARIDADARGERERSLDHVGQERREAPGRPPSRAILRVTTSQLCDI